MFKKAYRMCNVSPYQKRRWDQFFHHIETSQLICFPNQLTGFYVGLFNNYVTLKSPFLKQGYNGFPQTDTVLFKFSSINHRPLSIMDVCNILWNKHSALDIIHRFKFSREMMTDRRNGLLQLTLSNNKLSSSNLCMSETKEVLQLITMISPYCNSS